MIKIFVLNYLASLSFVFGYQIDALERAVQNVCGIFLKLCSYGTDNIYIDLNWKRHNFKTKQL